MANPELSIIIPAYNEEAVIASTVEDVATYVTTSQIPYEIVVIDDGSTDRTVDVVQGVMRRHRTVRLLQSNHLGKGGAVKHGMLEARGEHLLFMDADHSTHIREWGKCAPWLRDGYDIVIGSRKMRGADIRVRQPLLREAMGKVFTWLTNAVLATGVTDVTCGFKVFQARAAREVFRRQRLEGWGFDAEILFVARRLGYRIKEVPVVWRNDETTKVRLVQDTIRSFTELLEIRLGAWRGWYQ